MMETKDEILRIQRMVAEGKVTPEDAVELLESLGLGAPGPADTEGGRSAGARRAAFWSLGLLLACVFLGAACIIFDQMHWGGSRLLRTIVVGVSVPTMAVASIAWFLLGRHVRKHVPPGGASAGRTDIERYAAAVPGSAASLAIPAVMILLARQNEAAVVLGIVSFVLAMLFRRALDPDARSGEPEGEGGPGDSPPREEAGDPDKGVT